MHSIQDIKRRAQRGFTLIELMIVVGIIGILALIAIPNFVKFQTKTKQSEAKLNLKAIHTAAAAGFVENSNYTLCGDWCGWSPNGKQVYNYSNGTDTRAITTNTCTTYTNAAQTAAAYTAAATANIDSDATCDIWTIDDAGNLGTIANKNDVND